MSKKQILWVEDDFYRLESMIYPFRNSEYKFIIAFTAKEAIELIKEQSFNLIILDILIPSGEKNNQKNYVFYQGQQLLKEIRELRKSIPIIVFSVVGDPNLIEEIEAMGIKYYSKGHLLPSDFKKIIEGIT
jgi:DNA-binding response OmpR family regulator